MNGTSKAQSGIALILFLFLAIGIATTMALTTWNNSLPKQEQERQTLLALQQAKEAVIAWSVSRAAPGGSGFPGQLPCPEDTTLIGQPKEGQAETCGNLTMRIGRIAWRTLGLVNPLDGSGEQLWYVLAPSFRTVPPAGTIGIPTGSLQVDGVLNSAAVIIIAPGSPLAGQNRTVPNNSAPPQAINYLDLGNSSGSSFVTSGPLGTFNDRLITITSQELFQALRNRVLAETRGTLGQASGLRRYYNDYGQFPWADITGDGVADANQSIGGLPFADLIADNAFSSSSWINNWFSSVNYRRISPVSAQISIGNTIMSVYP
ncbi:hypothetical protein [Dechloromonas denitrificans]|uniref:hypothetical protein n=1 Tax=Dechloromonas denitrificans TaxID=281362 RepID=UPI001CFA8378|nr:hypothetical protein [Dechloromonas denitrificans]UCV08769.1 hypothetical protein KI615_04345 [Dechloromonas denitrificans]